MRPQCITLSADDLLALLNNAWVDGYQLGRRQIRAAFSAELFWMRFKRIGKCLVWTGPVKPNGYGQVRVNGKHKHTHVLAWELTHGPVPKGYEVCHNCPDGDNRACGDPDHLWLGTRAENMRDMYAKGRHRNGKTGRLTN
jgi:hypothetical protein